MTSHHQRADPQPEAKHRFDRIIRFTQTPMRDDAGRKIASLDTVRNVLTVDKEIFDLLEPWQQNQVLHARGEFYLANV